MIKEPADRIKTLDASPDAQDQRRLLLGNLVYKEVLPYFQEQDNEATLDHREHAGDTRLVLWFARSMLITIERRELANKLLSTLPLNQACHFSGMATMGILTRNGDLLTSAAKRNLENFILRYLSDWMTQDFRFFGANDNAPLGSNTTLSLAGHYFARPALVEFARERLRGLSRLLDLRGYIHECNSPTYTPFSLLSLAELADLSKDEETRIMALRAERRLWQELFLHLHPGMRQLMGPFSRGLYDDNANQCTNAMMVIYSACGEISPFNPVRMLFPPPTGTFAHNSWLFQWACCAGLGAAIYHPPLELAERCLEREGPFSILGNNEFMPIHGTPCGQTTVQVYGEKEWSLSSFGSRLWAGQTVPLHALYQRGQLVEGADIIERLTAIRSVYTRFHISENFASMGTRNGDKANEEVHLDHGAAFVVQHQGTAMLGYVPVVGPEKVRTMKASAIFPLHHSRPDEIWHGRRQVAGFSGSFPEADWAFVRDGDIYLAFYPLIAKQENAMLCTQQYADYGEYGMISFFSMSSFTQRSMDGKERRSFGSGLIMEISCARRDGTFEKFRNRLSGSQITHCQYGTQRNLSYSCDGVELELIYDFEQLNLRRAVVNGNLVSNTTKCETIPKLPLIS